MGLDFSHVVCQMAITVFALLPAWCYEDYWMSVQCFQHRSLIGVIIVAHFECLMYSTLVPGNRHIFIYHVIISLPVVLKFGSCSNIENLMCYGLFNKPEGISLASSRRYARAFHTVARTDFIWKLKFLNGFRDSYWNLTWRRKCLNVFSPLWF